MIVLEPKRLFYRGLGLGRITGCGCMIPPVLICSPAVRFAIRQKTAVANRLWYPWRTAQSSSSIPPTAAVWLGLWWQVLAFQHHPKSFRLVAASVSAFVLFILLEARADQEPIAGICPMHSFARMPQSLLCEAFRDTERSCPLSPSIAI